MNEVALFFHALAAVLGLILGIVTVGAAVYLWMRRRGL